MKASEVWGATITDEANPAQPPQEMREWVNQQTQIIHDAAAMGGLRFQAYLPSELALAETLRGADFLTLEAAYEQVRECDREADQNLENERDISHERDDGFSL